MPRAPLRRSPPHLSGQSDLAEPRQIHLGQVAPEVLAQDHCQVPGAGVADLDNLIETPGATDGRVDLFADVNALLLATRVVHRLSIP